MKLKTITIICLLACVRVIVQAQPVIQYCENFSVGTVLMFQECSTTGVSEGPAGTGQTWNFTTLTSLPDTSTEWMVTPGSTPFGSLFPASNLVERYSNGTFVYMNKTADTNYMMGYADSVNRDTIVYANTMIFAARPMAYGDMVTDTFTDIFTSSTFSFTGKGVCTITADGYGTLMLPSRTYNNVLRLKISQPQNDTSSVAAFGSATVSFVWFDSSHASALLKIDSTNSSGTITKSVEYLINESPSGVANVQEPTAYRLLPNPTGGEITLTQPGSNTGAVYHVTDLSGRELMHGSITGASQQIDVNTLPEGMYLLNVYERSARVSTIKFVKE